MDDSAGDAPARRVFTLDEARALLPRVRQLTEEAIRRFQGMQAAPESELKTVVEEWVRQMDELDLEVKGLWLVDFDSGAGYYCWKYPEAALDHFHGYDEGFSGRLPMN